MNLQLYKRQDAYPITLQFAEQYGVADYFDFPFSAAAFAESLRSSSLLVVDGIALFRALNKNLVLISYRCTGTELACILSQLVSDGYSVRTLNFVQKDFGGLCRVKYGNEFRAFDDWSTESIISNLTHHDGYKFRQAIKRGSNNYDLDDSLSLSEVMEVFEDWITFAKTRHFMVCRGHYQRYIEMYFAYKPSAVKLLGFRRRLDGALWGFIGYELFGDSAQITLGKHKSGDYYLSRYIWLVALESMLADGAKICFCGSTADELKNQLRLIPYKSYRLKV